MGIPVHTDFFLVHHIMRPDTNPASNTFVNTFFFRNDDPGSPVIDFHNDVVTALDAFYNSVNPPGGTKLSSFFSQVIDPALSEYRIYDLGQAEPRVPTVRDSNMTSTGTSGAPNECAVVLSYRSGTGSSGTGGTIDKTRRGRLYLGPLALTAFDVLTGDQDARVSSAMLDAVEGAALNLVNSSLALSWHQYSRVEDRFGIVTGGFVDNRADTQRRRGAEPSARRVWST